MEQAGLEINIAIGGSRRFTDYDFFKEELNKILAELEYDKIKLISGGAIGTDKLAERFAEESSIAIEIIVPQWRNYGKASAVIRNKQIVELADVVIAFWDGKSKGTISLIRYAKKMNKRLIIIDV